jgi:aldehyde oxidoreductase
MADTGAYSSTGIPVLDQATLFATGPYDIPNVCIDGLSIYTNNVPCGAMRGFGIPQSAFAIESMIDDLAQELHLEPIQVRRINGLRPGSFTVTGQPILKSVPYLETLAQIEPAISAAMLDLPQPEPGCKRGVGIASSYKNVGIGLGIPEPTSVIIKLTPEGRIQLLIGGAELGQGSDSTLAQIAAESLQVPYSLIDIVCCDTSVTPDGGITSGSRTTFMSGNAIVETVPLFLEQIRAELPYGTELTPFVLKQLAAFLQLEERTVSVEHTYTPPPTFPLSMQGEAERSKFVTFSYATQAAIVDVNTSTGEVKVLKMIAVHDVGRTINPQGARGQIEGSCVMGMGYALSEEFILDKGYLATDTLAKVGVPTINHSPAINVILVEDSDPHGPFGAKGIAEAAAVPSAPAILNAIKNATGVRICRLPATPDRVLRALQGLS